MVKLISGDDWHQLGDFARLLGPNEIIAIVDDSAETGLLISTYLANHGVTSRHVHSGQELYDLLSSEPVALILLDIGLPDVDGISILQEIVPAHPDLAIIMVTGTTSLDIALQCIRIGADDYLSKPITSEQLTKTILPALAKRRLALENRYFQQALETAHARTRFLHELNLQMNTVYLSNIELDSMLRAILVGITSDEGLKFNRAFLALFSDNSLDGTLAIGMTKREEANGVWTGIKEKNLQLHDIIAENNSSTNDLDVEINRIVRELRIPKENADHILIKSANERKTIIVKDGAAYDCEVPRELLELLAHSTFVVVPLFSPSKSLGVIIVDNFVTHKDIGGGDIHALELFANQASLAIEHSHLYEEMRKKINELELVNAELDKNKHLLVESEKYSAIGHMAAQLVHAIRNPITSIGGAARLLDKKNDDAYSSRFLDIIIQESAKVESTLKDIFSFVEQRELYTSPVQFYQLIEQSIVVFLQTMKNQGIEYKLNLPGGDPTLQIDEGKIRQMIMHLVKNGIEAMENGGLLAIGCQEDENGITLSINDSGHGISKNHADKVHDPFFTTKTYGTGMGLTLVEQIVDLHDAEFTMEKNENGGTTAKVLFPPSLIVHNQ